MNRTLTPLQLHQTSEYKAVFSALYAILNCLKPKCRKKAIKAVWAYLQEAEGMTAAPATAFSWVCMREALTACEKLQRFMP